MRKAGGDSSRGAPKAAVERVIRAGDWYVGGDTDWHKELLQTGDVIEFPV